MSHQMQAVETFCNMRTDEQTFSIVSPVENPLASLARVMQCITVNIIHYTREFGERARSASGLKQVLTKGGMGDNENHSQ